VTFLYRGRMTRGAVLVLLAACSFRSHEAGGPDGPIIDAPDIDAPDGGGSGSGSGSGSAVMAYRKPIAIDKTKVKGSLTDFPVWIDLTDADIAARAQADGSDIFFTDGGGTTLDHELVAYSAGTHHLQAWVRMPVIDTGTNTTIYVVYGDPSRAVTPKPAGVFKASFAAVWHLDDALNAAAVADATGTHAGTATGLIPTAQVGGQLAGGFSFDGSGTAYVTFTNMLSGSNPHTMSAWVNQGQTSAHSSVLAVGTNATDKARFLYANYQGQDTLGIGQYSDDWFPSGNDLRQQGWKYLVYTLEGSNRKVHVFVDGAEITGSPHTLTSAANTPNGGTGYIATAPSGFGAAGMLGTLDEVRIATVQRSPQWIGTEWNNQGSPGTFYAVGAEQVAP